ncbi:hypothetical protein B296_00051288 [Ensete ventricosum]|uniref:Uncharacterized protein n=1 Tax=Ensete ventricosum TaxID=4639 RepID=A0A426XE96_ENSVE|nr:hypothetical protein B296_00051288 [Ensete ventricosum]
MISTGCGVCVKDNDGGVAGSRERDDRSARRKCRGSRLEGEALAVDSRGGGRWWLGDCSERRVLAASPLATVAERRSRSYSRVPLPADEGWEMAEAATTAEEGDGDVSQRKKECAGATMVEEGDARPMAATVVAGLREVTPKRSC